MLYLKYCVPHTETLNFNHMIKDNLICIIITTKGCCDSIFYVQNFLFFVFDVFIILIICIFEICD